jgi:hypothetical protein
MRRTTAWAGSLVLLATIPAACSTEPEPAGAITADEQRQLDEAAEMLDANSVSADLFEDANATAPKE